MSSSAPPADQHHQRQGKKRKYEEDADSDTIVAHPHMLDISEVLSRVHQDDRTTVERIMNEAYRCVMGEVVLFPGYTPAQILSIGRNPTYMIWNHIDQADPLSQRDDIGYYQITISFPHDRRITYDTLSLINSVGVVGNECRIRELGVIATQPRKTGGTNGGSLPSVRTDLSFRYYSVTKPMPAAMYQHQQLNVLYIHQNPTSIRARNPIMPATSAQASFQLPPASSPSASQQPSSSTFATLSSLPGLAISQLAHLWNK